jgi:hypothetical protein
MPRERREFKRPTFIRDVQKLFVIASEGIKTEVKYLSPKNIIIINRFLLRF